MIVWDRVLFSVAVAAGVCIVYWVIKKDQEKLKREREEKQE